MMRLCIPSRPSSNSSPKKGLHIQHVLGIEERSEANDGHRPLVFEGLAVLRLFLDLRALLLALRRTEHG